MQGSDRSTNSGSQQSSAPQQQPNAAAGASSSSRSSKSSSGVVRPRPLDLEPAEGTWLSLGAYEDVLNSSFDYWEVNKELKTCGMVMTRIMRIYNSEMEEQFEEECKKIKKLRPPGFDINIGHIYHGTTAPLDMICAEGLDTRLSPKGHFGQGIYFSDSPEMCRAYCEDPDNRKEKNFVVRCKVILGDQKVYPPGQFDPSLTREPVKHVIDNKHVYYDSVKGCVGQYNQFVVYENRRVFVQFVVFYTTDRDVPVIPDVPTPKKPSSSRDRKFVVPKAHANRPNVPSGTHAASADRSSSDNSSDDSSRSGSPTPADRPLSGDEGGGAFSGRAAASQNASTGWQVSEDSVKRVSVTRRRTKVVDSVGSCDSPSAGSTQSAAAATAATGPSANAGTALKTFSAAPHSGPDPAHLQLVQQAAITHMMALKSKISDAQFDQLLVAYEQTYGDVFMQQLQASRASALAVSHPPNVVAAPPTLVGASNDLGAADDDDDDEALSDDADGITDPDVRCVLDQLVNDFKLCAVGVDPKVARQFLISNDMDLDVALCAYFDASSP